MTTLNFPRDFIWGTATSSFQIEGATDVDGRGPSIWDTFCATPGKISDGSDGTVVCDHYHRYKEDVAIMASLGLDAYRFSIAWPRVQPKGFGEWNEAGFKFYENLITELEAKGIKPHVTLYHWDLPQALQDRGGWANRETVKLFAEYAAEVGRRFGHRVASIATHNEPWCTAYLGNHLGRFAPGFKDVALANQVSHHLLLSHGEAIKALRALNIPAQLGIVLNQSDADPATDSAADKRQAQLEYENFTGWFMDPIFKGHYPPLALEVYGDAAPKVQEGDFETIGQKIDFLGVNYYFRAWCSTDTPKIPEPCELGRTDMGWEIYPKGLTDLLLRLKREYADLPPILITENGMANPDTIKDGAVNDPQRIDFLQRHLGALKDAMDAGVDIRGYFEWSLLDNFEWDSGLSKRFGIVHVDYQTQKRTLKDSAHWYREFISQQKKG
ncbi:GH1 family beta-glucosidase [Silvimonas iriomotensis]|uniref:Beta-glucosidase n=1 Tax=Silvimonas iriomotensis TaxID=449662 RepID=A0ABQ2P401_9NEIS|nr:GH1 family beta-glucosidase [Silvimonas iriomotensis]GGP17851.1 beta-glucosidase [Silvimonas iriomotensis]